jgi:glycosyltransferase involved in cell wall biosynthesis
MARKIVNHVLSSATRSAIFDYMLAQFAKYSDSDFEHRPSVDPLPGADLYHYHRPHLVENLKASSVITLHHSLDGPLNWVDPQIAIQRCREATHVVCLNKTQYEQLASAKLDNMSIIPHGYSPEVISGPVNRTYSASRPYVLGFLSKRYPNRIKGEALLFELAKRLDRTRIAFLLIGEGRQQDATMLKTFGFKVACDENRAHAEFGRVYQAMSALLVLSRAEGGPACLPEALASATPIFSTRVGAAPDVIHDNGIFLSGDPDRDAALIMAVALNERGLADKLIAGAAHAAKSVPTWESVIQDYQQMYRYVLGQGVEA